MKIKLFISLAFFFLSRIALAQDTSCQKITVSKKVYNANVNSGGNNHGGGSTRRFFLVGDNKENQKFGMFYKNLKPYILCTPTAMTYFNRAAHFDMFQTGFLAGMFAGGTIVSLAVPQGPQQNNLIVPIVFVPLTGFIVSLIIKRINIKRCINAHNAALTVL